MQDRTKAIFITEQRANLFANKALIWQEVYKTKVIKQFKQGELLGYVVGLYYRGGRLVFMTNDQVNKLS